MILTFNQRVRRGIENRVCIGADRLRGSECEQKHPCEDQGIFNDVLPLVILAKLAQGIHDGHILKMGTVAARCNYESTHKGVGPTRYGGTVDW